jgi:biotin operon repressor
MNTEEKVLDALKKSKDAMSAGQLAEKTGIDRKEIDRAMKSLKDTDLIISPKRCYWTAK